MTIRALDLFAGTGWGVACRRLGIREMGVELMPEAVATRTANGMPTIYHDVWEGLTGGLFVPSYDLLIASPPCQTFSMAGSGAGRRALDEVMEAVRTETWKDPQLLLDFGAKHDMRTALVLTPLAHVWRDRPRFVAFEQVPTVLPVWEACAVEMRKMGYSVQVANLHAEQYGVPQTRKRVILVARLDGPVALPMPTHSKYYPRTPGRLDEGVAKWVSMAEALGWVEQRVVVSSQSVAGGDRARRTADQPAFTVTTNSDRVRHEPVAFTQNNRQAHQTVRSMDQPAPTVTAGHDSGNRGFLDADGQLTVATPEKVAALQPYPNAVAAAVADPRPGWAYQRPATTIVGTHTPSVVAAPAFRGKGAPSRQAQPGSVRVTPSEAAALQSYPSRVGFPRLADSDDVVTLDGVEYRARDLRPDTAPAQVVTEKARSWNRYAEDGTSRPVSVDEAATLQSYEPPFVWCGTKTKQFLQIGNAVPPLLAQHILHALTEGI